MGDDLLADISMPVRPRVVELADDDRLTDLLRETEDALGLS